MSGLISSNEAKLAWATGEQLQVAHLTRKAWETLTDNYMLSVFDNDSYVFRLTPRTITLNNIEVPAPFEPKDKDNGYVIDLVVSSNPWNESDPETYRVGAWRTDEEIKQVVSALRSVFEVTP